MHDDPADRMIVATAQVLGAGLVTKDQRLRRYRHVKAIW
jgi:PIN domain nuclease of toxin-antitoxin system